MDDFNLSSLRESRNEWCIRLINILTPQLVLGIRSIFNSAKALCLENGEMDKYLLTFQNFLTRIPKWNNELIQQERERICEASGCKYLEDLITCVHIIQLKMLTSIRVGNKQKKVDLSIPKLDDFIHKTYIHAARQMYNKAYLFSLDVKPMEQQKNNSEIELILQKCILDAVRDTIPLEYILRSYLEETEEVVDEVKEEIIKETIKPLKPEPAPAKEKKETASPIGLANIPERIPTPFETITTHIGGDPIPLKNPLPSDFSSSSMFDKIIPESLTPIEKPSVDMSAGNPEPSLSTPIQVDDFGLIEEADLDFPAIDGGDALELNF
jgi:hypothetical protein